MKQPRFNLLGVLVQLIQGLLPSVLGEGPGESKHHDHHNNQKFNKRESGSIEALMVIHNHRMQRV